MRVRVICSLRLLGCFPRGQTSVDPEIHRSRAEALRLKRVTRLESLGTASCPVSRVAAVRAGGACRMREMRRDVPSTARIARARASRLDGPLKSPSHSADADARSVVAVL